LLRGLLVQAIGGRRIGSLQLRRAHKNRIERGAILR